MFDKYSVIEESMRIAQKMIMEAKRELDIFPHSREKEALLVMSDYALAREK